MRISCFEADKGYVAYDVNASAGYYHHVYVDDVFYEFAMVADDVLGYALVYEGENAEGEVTLTLVYGDVKIERVNKGN